MNKVAIERHADGNYSITMPDGSQRPYVSPAEAADSLKGKEAEFQQAIDDMKAVRQRFEKEAAKG